MAMDGARRGFWPSAGLPMPPGLPSTPGAPNPPTASAVPDAWAAPPEEEEEGMMAQALALRRDLLQSGVWVRVM